MDEDEAPTQRQYYPYLEQAGQISRRQLKSGSNSNEDDDDNDEESEMSFFPVPFAWTLIISTPMILI